MRHILFASLLYCTSVLSSRRKEFRGLRQCFSSVHYCRFGNDATAFPCTKQPLTTDDHLMKHRNLTVLDTTAFCASNLPPRVKVSKKATAMPLTLPNDDRSIVVKCPRNLWGAECWLVVHNHVLSSSALPRTIISLSEGSKRSDPPRLKCRIEWKTGAVILRNSWFVRGESIFYKFAGHLRDSPLETYVTVYPFESENEENYECGVRVLVSKLLSVSISSTYNFRVNYKPTFRAPSTRPSRPVTPTKPEIVRNGTLLQFCGDKKPLASKIPTPSRSTASLSPTEITSVSQKIVPKGSDPSEFPASPSPIKTTTSSRRIVLKRSGASNSKEPHTVYLAILIYACLRFP